MLEKIEKLKSLFEKSNSPEERYKLIISLGQRAARFNSEYKTEENRVHGCQSTTYVRSFEKEEKIFFESDSDALISAGLAYLLVNVYSGETMETILKCPPTYLEEMGISSSITPSRANGLYSMYLHMKKQALKHLVAK